MKEEEVEKKDKTPLVSPASLFEGQQILTDSCHSEILPDSLKLTSHLMDSFYEAWNEGGWGGEKEGQERER